MFLFFKRLPDQPRPTPNVNQAAKTGQPEKAVVSTLKSQVSESGSSDSSDSEEESPAAQKQPPQAGKLPGSSQDPSPASLWVSYSPRHMKQLLLWTATETILSHSDNLLHFSCSENQFCAPTNKREKGTNFSTSHSPSSCGQQ